MVQYSVPDRKCPACGSDDYQFRSRKRVAAEPGAVEAEAVETKYRCKACGREWRVRIPADPGGQGTGREDAEPGVGL